MILHFGTDLVEAEWKSSTVCIGVFDGVHLGHQAVITTAVATAKSKEQPCILVTFDRHPAWIVAPERVPVSLATLGQNFDQFRRLGVSLTVVLAFDKETASTSADDFLQRTLKGRLRAERLVTGHDFAFGNGRQGNAEWLLSRIENLVVPPIELEGRRVSSTEIRGLVAAGQVEKAARFLGRPFSLHGVIVPGEKRGRNLGYPTVNIALSSRQAVPAEGVYGGWCTTSRGRFLAATGIGRRPTFGGGDRSIEAFLLDYPGDEIYGEAVELGFSQRVRDDMNFPNVDDLVRQMDRDVSKVRQLAD